MTYTRPGWTGGAMRFSDGREDPEWAQCPSCLAYHHRDSKSCNGKRHHTDERCDAAIGEVQCDRPEGHLGPHEAKGGGLRVEWEVTA